MKWSQKILFNQGQFSLSVPFSFPSYVTPVGMKLSKKEMIFLKVNSGAAREVSCNISSHPLKVKPSALLQSSVWPLLDMN